MKPTAVILLVSCFLACSITKSNGLPMDRRGDAPAQDHDNDDHVCYFCPIKSSSFLYQKSDAPAQDHDNDDHDNHTALIHVYKAALQAEIEQETRSRETLTPDEQATLVQSVENRYRNFAVEAINAKLIATLQSRLKASRKHRQQEETDRYRYHSAKFDASLVALLRSRLEASGHRQQEETDRYRYHSAKFDASLMAMVKSRLEAGRKHRQQEETDRYRYLSAKFEESLVALLQSRLEASGHRQQEETTASTSNAYAYGAPRTSDSIQGSYSEAGDTSGFLRDISPEMAPNFSFDYDGMVEYRPPQ